MFISKHKLWESFLTTKNPFSLFPAALVDELLASYDVNNDGLLDFPEFMKGFHEQSHKMSWGQENPWV